MAFPVPTGWSVVDGLLVIGQMKKKIGTWMYKMVRMQEMEEWISRMFSNGKTRSHPMTNDQSTPSEARTILPYTVERTRTGAPDLPTIRTYEATRDALHEIENKAGATTRSRYTYAVNAIGQRTGLSTAFDLGTGLASNPGATAWAYDDLGQIQTADAPGTAADRAYQYDSIGNRLFSETGAAQIPATPGTGTLAYAPNALDQYDSITPHDQNGNPLPSFTPTHDDDGNLKNGQLRTIASDGTPTPYDADLTWNADNRLVKVKNGASTVATYDYDYLGRRISKTVGTATTYFIYDGWNLIAEYEISNSQFQITKAYLWGLDLSNTLQGAGGVGGLLAVTVHAYTTANPPVHTSATYYPTYDGNANVSEKPRGPGGVLEAAQIFSVIS